MDSREYSKTRDRSLDRYSPDRKSSVEKRSRDEYYGSDYRYHSSSSHRDKRRNYGDDSRSSRSSRDYRDRSRERSSWSSRRPSRERSSRKERSYYRRDDNNNSSNNKDRNTKDSNGTVASSNNSHSHDHSIPTGPKADTYQQQAAAHASYYHDPQQQQQQQQQQAWNYYGWADYNNYHQTAEYTAEQYQQYAQYYYAYYDPNYYHQQQQQEVPPPPPPSSSSMEQPPPPPPPPSTDYMPSSTASPQISQSTNDQTIKEDISEESFSELGYPFETNDDPAVLFEKIGQVGEGTYGKVYKARNGKTGKLMALKRIRMKNEKDGFPITAVREIKLLQKLKHEKIIELQQIMVSKGCVYMVLEYMDHDLSGILGHPNFTFQPSHAKSLVKQMLEGLAYLHHMGILHRDIKGSNLLINNKGELKIADFGLARVFEKNETQDYTNRVITLWYRPPELLLGATAYGPAVDIWSVGCIMLEFFTGKAIFNGVDEISQLDSIYRIMGTPTVDTWPTLTELPWYELVRPTEVYAPKFKELYGSLLSPGALELSQSLLSMDPQKRPTAAEALEFAYFKTEQPEPVMPAK
ncbi:hypothetical protein G6F71_004475 [Rhizopus microsporus]|nr:hypothetical protein G6F71_004475 [Rhizopus microsporus]KAG1209328.1 hypothetical protein G6F69_006448 [Rhizopus microsporus]KAG1230738.1 hypothetical protein G6F67_006258 [Rhizopus microsporus]KAG1263712.1 hypothetical protein G6F68_004940 [Rhizopus microsporus]